MGMLDASLQFSNSQAITASAASTNMYDSLTGETDTTTFTKAPKDIWGTSKYFGEDLGIGKGLGTPRIVVNTGTVAWTTTTGMTVQFRGAPNNDTAQASGNRSDLAFVTYIQTEEILIAALVINTRICAFDWPMRAINVAALTNPTGTVATYQLPPRFYELYYLMDTSAGAGTVTADVTLGDDDAQAAMPYFASNFSVAS